mmetsp:Transcript_7973/g.16606  ORF Transcript_7973/g.16606 Transcript_7973/m.16606 type:complete len:80 (+) Transcript_7973:27-266(+)
MKPRAAKAVVDISPAHPANSQLSGRAVYIYKLLLHYSFSIFLSNSPSCLRAYYTETFTPSVLASTFSVNYPSAPMRRKK